MVWIVVLGFEKKRKAKAPAAERATHVTRIREMKAMVVGVDLCEESEEEVESVLKERSALVGLGGSSSWVGTGFTGANTEEDSEPILGNQLNCGFWVFWVEEIQGFGICVWIGTERRKGFEVKRKSLVENGFQDQQWTRLETMTNGVESKVGTSLVVDWTSFVSDLVDFGSAVWTVRIN